ncbi:MAG: preprotein translocase subunit SecG [Clostridiaceae bacterium]|jgi:preprotein translocase subunit SecG|nr:preprotein translocase subunit SecG [Clostridiaceae bacterium]
MQIAVNILHILFCVSLIIIVLFQSAKQEGLSGAISGGAETFFGKNKGRTVDAILGKWTAVAAVGFLITSIVLQIMFNS